MVLDENDVLKYVEGKVIGPPENAATAVESKYKKVEIKAKKILIDSLKNPLLTYVSKIEEI